VPAYFLILVMLALMWLLLIRPQRRRQLEQQQLLSRLAPGDEVVTAGGLYGTIADVVEDEVRLEIAPGTTVRVAKRAVAAIVTPDEEEQEELEEADETHPLGESADDSSEATLSTDRG
jgi:preprotein translocase subunit YajC